MYITSPASLETRQLDRLAVVLVSPRNTLNIGAVARAMSNFGAHDLRVANIFYKDFRSASSAVGPSAALLRGARDYPTTAEAVRDAQLVVGTSGALGSQSPGESPRPHLQPLERLEHGAVRIRAALERGEKVALLFGSEKFGLSNDDMSHCHLLLRIPTRDEHPSMNLGQAAALCLYELARIGPNVEAGAEADQAAAAPAISQVLPQTTAQTPRLLRPGVYPHLPQNFPRTAEQGEPADAAALERVTGLLEQALSASGYPGMGPSMRTRQLRTLIRRLQLSECDASLAAGFLRQMLWKLEGPERRTEPG